MQFETDEIRSLRSTQKHWYQWKETTLVFLQIKNKTVWYTDIWYDIIRFNIPLDTLQVIVERKMPFSIIVYTRYKILEKDRFLAYPIHTCSRVLYGRSEHIPYSSTESQPARMYDTQICPAAFTHSQHRRCHVNVHAQIAYSKCVQ